MFWGLTPSDIYWNSHILKFTIWWWIEYSRSSIRILFWNIRNIFNKNMNHQYQFRYHEYMVVARDAFASANEKRCSDIKEPVNFGWNFISPTMTGIATKEKSILKKEIYIHQAKKTRYLTVRKDSRRQKTGHDKTPKRQIRRQKDKTRVFSLMYTAFLSRCGG
jgi:hypothetical protein